MKTSITGLCVAMILLNVFGYKSAQRAAPAPKGEPCTIKQGNKFYTPVGCGLFLFIHAFTAPEQKAAATADLLLRQTFR